MNTDEIPLRANKLPLFSSRRSDPTRTGGSALPYCERKYIASRLHPSGSLPVANPSKPGSRRWDVSLPPNAPAGHRVSVARLYSCTVL